MQQHPYSSENIKEDTNLDFIFSVSSNKPRITLPRFAKVKHQKYSCDKKGNEDIWRIYIWIRSRCIRIRIANLSQIFVKPLIKICAQYEQAEDEKFDAVFSTFKNRQIYTSLKGYKARSKRTT